MRPEDVRFNQLMMWLDGDRDPTPEGASQLPIAPSRPSERRMWLQTRVRLAFRDSTIPNVEPPTGILGDHGDPLAVMFNEILAEVVVSQMDGIVQAFGDVLSRTLGHATDDHDPYQPDYDDGFDGQSIEAEDEIFDVGLLRRFFHPRDSEPMVNWDHVPQIWRL